MIADLPEEIISEILQYLQFHDVLNTSTCSKALRRICHPFFESCTLILPNPHVEACSKTWTGWGCRKVLLRGDANSVLDEHTMELLMFSEEITIDSAPDGWLDILVSTIEPTTRLIVSDSSFALKKLQLFPLQYHLSNCRLQLEAVERPSKYRPPQQLIPRIFCTSKKSGSVSDVVLSNCRIGQKKLEDSHISELFCFHHLACYSSLTKLILDRSAVTAEILSQIQQKCSNLLELSLRDCIGLSGVDTIVGSMMMLEKLCLSGLPELTSVYGLVRLRNLKELDISNCRSLVNISPLGELITSLEKLDLSQLPVSSLEVLTVFRLPAIQTLVLSGCLGVTNSIISRINAPNLRAIELSSCMGLDEVSISTVIAQSTQLTHLNIGWLKSSPNLLSSSSTFLRYTSTLILSHTPTTDAHLAVLAKHRPNSLRFLSVDFCRKVTDLGIRHIASISSLVKLNLDHLDRLTDTSLYSISEGLPVLGSLSLTGCQGLTGLGLGSLKHNRRLRSINLHRCPNITNESVERLKKKLTVLWHIGYNKRYEVSV